PVRGRDHTMLGLMVLWVRAAALWDLMKTSDGLAGKDSFAVLFDHYGIRIAHTYNRDMVFHPGGAIAPSTVDALVSERRFGNGTAALLADVKAFPEHYDHAR